MEVVLKIPSERSESKEWIVLQPPEVVADIFDVAKELFKFTSCMASVQVNNSSQNIARLTKSISEKDSEIGELHGVIEKMKLEINSKAIEISKNQMRLNEEIHRNEIDDLRKRQTNMLKINEDQMKTSYENVICRYEEEINKLKKELDTLNKKFDTQRNNEMSINSHMSDILRESTTVLKQFTKDVSTGFTGEELVRSVFNEDVNIGYLEDTSRSTEPGSEDYLWKSDEITGSVEVKFKSSIHSKNDMEKHRLRIYEAARMKKINIGIFLSLKCKIPNKPILSVENVSGIPVVYAALGTDMSPKHIIYNAFIFANALAKRIISETKEDSPQILIDQIILSFEKFVKNLNKQQELIYAMRRQVNQNFRCLESLEKIKNEMISGIEGLRTDFPLLCPVTEDTDNSNDETDIIQAILDYVDKYKRYPTNPNQLPNALGCSIQELNNFINEAKREKKRKLAKST